MVTVQECLTWTVGRGGIKHLTPWEGTKISSPCAFGARGRNFYTFPWGEVFYTSPSNCWGMVHIQPVWVFFRTCWFNTSLDCTLPSQHIHDFISFGLRWMCNVQMPLDFQLEKMRSDWWWFLGNLHELDEYIFRNAGWFIKISVGKRIPWGIQDVVRIRIGTKRYTNGSKVRI